MLINEIHARHQRITQHIGFGLMPSPFGTLLPEKSGHPRYSLFFSGTGHKRISQENQ